MVRQCKDNKSPRSLLPMRGWLILALLVWSIGVAPAAEVITRAREVLMLDKEEAARGLPVQLDAWVTYADSAWGVLFVEDKSSGIYVGLAGAVPALEQGDRVTVHGWSSPGQFAPSVGGATLIRINERVTPTPVPIEFDELLLGRWDSQFVELECTVRAIAIWDDHMALQIIEGTESTYAIIPYVPTPLPNLEGARVRLCGTAGASFNRKQQVIKSQILVQDLDCIEVLVPAPLDDFSAPLRSIEDLNRFSPEPFLENRIRLQGTVVAFEPGSNIYMRDNTGSIRIVTVQSEPPLEPGDQVVVSGFRAVHEARVVLESATYKKVGSTTPPRAAAVTAEDATTGQFDSELIRIIGEVSGISSMYGGYLMSVITDDSAFTAWIAQTPGEWSPPKLSSVVELTGICDNENLDLPESTAFQLRLRSTNDVEIISEPSWWTPKHSMIAALSVSGLLILASAWGITLRNRVRSQTNKLEESMRQEVALEKRFRMLFESSPDAMYVFDEIGRVLDCNPAASRMFGRSRHEINQLTAIDLVDEEHHDAFKRHLQKFLNEGRAQFDCLLKNHSGTTFPAEIHIGRVEFADQSCILMQVRDISARKSLENQLLQSQKMEAVGQLAAGVAHDFNNILTVISGHISLLADDFPPDGAEALAFTDMREAVDRASRLTRQLLTFSRRQPANLSPISINDAVTNMTRMLRYVIGENIAIDFRYTQGTTLVRGDVGMIEQIVVNLAVNARDAMPRGGRLKIETELVRLGENELDIHPNGHKGEFVTLSVEDGGCGMSPETQARIFEPFFTTKEVGKGTGLGLATVYGIVQEHNGWIEVESEVGSGSKFTVYFPVLNVLDEIEPAEPESPPLDLPQILSGNTTINNGRILIAEDEAPVRKLLGDILDRGGYQVAIAEDGPRAESIWKDDIDLLITDLVMPEGITGYELAKRLRARKPDLKVIYCTGYPPDQFTEEVKLVEGENLLRKPFTPQSVSAIVRRTLSVTHH